MLAVASPIAHPNFSRSAKDPDNSQQQPRGLGIDAILQDTVEFVEGSSTGLLAQTESKYPYINTSSDESTHKLRIAGPSSPSRTTSNAPTTPSSVPHRSLYSRPILTTWVMPGKTTAGFINTGNTCFLNSVLQCLIHTSPLQHLLNQHGTPRDECRVPGPFCMACKLRVVMEAGFEKRSPFIPSPVVKNLNRIAKHMRHGRQEDAHEFLRYSVDALQRACLAGHHSKVDPKIAETTWVHKLFGGRLRSRVTCSSCSHPSDTFDSILDLSVDIQNVGSVKQALAKFVQVDHLRGANKYKCERCCKPVNAEKQFTVHDAPMCLTVHLKRFTPLGRKIGHVVEYNHTLDLQPVMSDGQHGPRYSLYGVILHAGSGPNSGHYYAHVKGSDGHWYDANDESVVRCSASTVIGRKNAYMLFYIRQQDDVLGEAIGMHRGMGSLKQGVKRKTPSASDGEDCGERTQRSSVPPPSTPKRSDSQFIGPRLPSPISIVPRPDPQALALQAKIAKAKAAQKVSLVPYSSDAEDEGEDEIRTPNNVLPASATSPPSSGALEPRSSSPSIPPSSFYGNTSQVKKRKDIGADNDGSDIPGSGKRHRLSPPEAPKRALGTPFTAYSMSNNLHASRDQLSTFNPPHRGPRQKIAGIGGVGIYHSRASGITSKMKTRSLF